MHVGGDGWLKTLDFVPRTLAAPARRPVGRRARRRVEPVRRAPGFPRSASDIVLRPAPVDGVRRPVRRAADAGACCCGHLRPRRQPAARVARHHRARGVRNAAGARPASNCRRSARSSTSWASAPTRTTSTATTTAATTPRAPFVFGETLRREAMVILAEIGVAVKYGHSEVGYIEADEADARHLGAARDRAGARSRCPRRPTRSLLTQWVLRNLAHQPGMRCSFDPDPARRATPAAACTSTCRRCMRDGRQTSPQARPTAASSAEARWLIGGLARCSGALMAFGNRASRAPSCG